MDHLPQDPMMLYSFLNTKLRDQYRSLDALCEDMGIDREEIVKKLERVGFEYKQELNKFV